MHPTSRLFLALYLAYLIADLSLKTPRLARNKEKEVFALIARAAVHFGMTILILLFFVPEYMVSLRTYLVLGVFIISHAALDQLKYWATTRSRSNNFTFLLIGLFGDLGMIIVVSLYLSSGRISEILHVSDSTKQHMLAIGVIYVLVVFAGGYLIRYLTRSLARNLVPDGETKEELTNAGLYIGWLERFLVLTAIAIQSPTMVGLILTGKSIARFPELKEPKFAEYFLIGTFLSISIAILGGLIIAHVVWGTSSLK